MKKIVVITASLSAQCNSYCCTFNHCTLVDVTANDTAVEGTVRLVEGSSPLEGRVEIFLLGQWGTVCNSYWDFADARVVCLELGYLRAVEAPTTFGAGSGPSWYSHVRCTGAEVNLTECSRYFSSFGTACSHTQSAGAVCSSESYIQLSICCRTYLVWYSMFVVYSVLAII